MSVTTLRVGAAKVDITPDWPLPLAGFAGRGGVLVSEIASPIMLRAAVLESRSATGTIRAVVVSADILWWGPEFVPGYRAEIARRIGVPAENILLAATHNHSAPQTTGRFAPALGLPDPHYLAMLEQRLIEAVERAAKDLEPVSIRRGATRHDLGLNRRGVVDGERRIAPNPARPTDPELTVVAFDRERGDPKCLLVHYACHPVISTGNRITGEFPGAAMREIERRTGAVALFLQGCSGDINPGVTDRSRFVEGGEAEIQATGLAMAEAVLAILGNQLEEVTPVPLQPNVLPVSLPFAAVPDQTAIEAASGQEGIDGEWGRAMLADPGRLAPTATLTLQRLDLADGLSLLAFDAEVVIEYGLHVKSLSGGRTLPVGCANGMIGYLPTAAQLAEGGYGPVGSTRYFLLPGPFAPEIEPIVRAAVQGLVTR